MPWSSAPVSSSISTKPSPHVLAAAWRFQTRAAVWPQRLRRVGGDNVIGSGPTLGGRPGRRDGHSHAHSRLGDHAHANPSHGAEGRADRRNAKERSAYRADACSYRRPTQGPVGRRRSAPAERHPSHNHQAGNALAASKNGDSFCHGNAEPSTNIYRIRGGGPRRLGMGSRERWGAGPLWAIPDQRACGLTGPSDAAT